MGWLIGLPLGLFRILGGFVLLLLRFAVPVVLLLLVVMVLRRRRGGSPRQAKEPEFDGPVYTVDYKVVEEEQED
ncbi:MAG: hypothetical protein PUC45_05600 [Oscillospiraceae bacterium]|nr:hypothetical protein [Oscillospiraceae bacterium]